jgi:hypothetical protein
MLVESNRALSSAYFDFQRSMVLSLFSSEFEDVDLFFACLFF